MAVKTNKPETTTELSADGQTNYADNPAINKKIDAHIAAFPKDFAYYTKLVKENPDRAVRKLVQKDQQRFESEMKLVTRQMPGAKEFYEKQPAEVRERIDRALKDVNPYFHDKAFVGEVLREMGRQDRKALTAGVSTAPRAAVG